MAKGLVNIEIQEAAMNNLNRQMEKLKRYAPEKAKGGMIKILFDIKALAQNKLKYNNHIVTSRLINSIYVQTPIPTNAPDNSETYRDNDGKVYKSELDVHLNDNEGAVGTNVEYAAAIEYGAKPHIIEAKNFPVLGNIKSGFFGKKVNHPGFVGDSFLYWALKNVDLDKRWRELSKELLGMNR